MSNEQEHKDTFDPVVQPFVEFWSGYWKQADEATRRLVEGVNGGHVKSWQRRWSDAVSKSVDAYLRSPMFLQTMKQNTDALVKAKQHVNDLASEFARNANIPTASDISGLFERLHSVEEAILARLTQIEERLTSIERQAGAGETVGSDF